MVKLSVSVDTKEFDKAMQEYIKNSKRSLTEIVNKKAYFIARNAVNTTQTTPKPEIRRSLMVSSRKDPRAPLVALLDSARRKRDGLKGVTGQQKTNSIEKFIKLRERTRNFLRAGWIATIKAIEPFVQNKGGAPKYDRTVKIKGRPKGGAKGAPLYGSWSPSAVIWNAIFGGKKASPRVTALLEKGLQEAVNLEIRSIYDYITKELQKNHDKFNKH
jgi:hypothetical protein